MATLFVDPRTPSARAERSAPATVSITRHDQAAVLSRGQDAPSRYGQSDRRPLLIAVVVVHALLIFALIKLDVVHSSGHHRHALTVMEIQPPAAPPPPVVQPQPQTKEAPPEVRTPIVAPPPIVSLPVAPPPVVAAPAPPPPSPQPAAPPAAAIVAPVVPPDGMAANLGNAGPRYPLESRRQHEEGTVRLRVLISLEGAVQEISIARSSGFERLDKAALEAVRRWKFRPGSQAGKPVEAIGFLSIPFALTRA